MEMSPKEMGSYLKRLRENKGLSTREVYELSKVSNSYLSLVENGHRRASAVVLKKLAPVYGVDYLDLYIKAGYIDLVEDEKNKMLKKIGAIPLIDIDTVKIPILGTVKAGYDYLAQENVIDYIAFKVDGTDKENYYALNVVGDSMTPLFDDGDTVIVHKQEEFKNGDNCVVLINGNEATIKKVYKGNTGIELKAVNPYYPPRIYSEEDIKELPIQIIGVVEKSIRNFNKK